MGNLAEQSYREPPVALCQWLEQGAKSVAFKSLGPAADGSFTPGVALLLSSPPRRWDGADGWREEGSWFLAGQAYRWLGDDLIEIEICVKHCMLSLCC